jgi:selenocysteine lyase/cysteine desulfurase
MSVRWRNELGKRHIVAARSVVASMLHVNLLNESRSSISALPGTSGDIILGATSSGLLRALATAYASMLRPGDEVVVCEWSHEAHIAPWLWAAQQAGATVVWWRLDAHTMEPPPAATLPLSPKTRIVALTHVSNILGTATDVAGATRRAKASGDVTVVVDGVAFVPHRAPDMADLGCDW